jgi:dTDP-4-dehydrorhamnose reductase
MKEDRAVGLGPVLITGAAGQLGSDLERLLAPSVEVAAPGQRELDITDDAAVESALARVGPSLVINCAAFHDVPLCESQEQQALRVNCVAVKRLAERCAEHGSRLVHFSTNYVFDGRRAEPYAEDDRPAPESAYAISKLAGERAALAYAPGSLVVRTAGLYGLRGSASKGGNFVVRILARARDGKPLSVVADQRLSPTFTADLAEAVIEAVEAGQSGLLHLTSSGACSWHQFAEAILELAGVEAPVEGTATSWAPGEPRRPLNGVLARPAADAAGLTPLRDWREALADYMERAGLAAVRAG